MDPDVRTVRLSPSFAPGSPAGPRLPVILSATAAGRLDLDVGDVLEIPLDGTYERLRTRVTAVVPAVPGAPDESAVLIDLHAVHQALLHDQEVVSPPTDLWVGTARPGSAAESLRHVLPANARIDTAADAAGRTVLATAVLAWWLGALGCGLLALLTLVTVGRGQLRSRRGDIAILRALGLTVREQQVLRGRELAWTTCSASPPASPRASRSPFLSFRSWPAPQCPSRTPRSPPVSGCTRRASSSVPSRWWERWHSA